MSKMQRDIKNIKKKFRIKDRNVDYFDELSQLIRTIFYRLNLLINM